MQPIGASRSAFSGGLRKVEFEVGRHAEFTSPTMPRIAVMLNLFLHPFRRPAPRRQWVLKQVQDDELIVTALDRIPQCPAVMLNSFQHPFLSPARRPQWVLKLVQDDGWWGQSRETKPGCQIHPLRIFRFNQVDFPLPVPPLQLLFASNGRDHVFEQLEADEQINLMLSCESGDLTCPMLV